MFYYVYPNGDIYSSEDYTLDELITSGHSDDCFEMFVPDHVEEPEDWIYEQLMAVDLGENCNTKTKY
jgi:hypothetical protein